MPATVIVGAQWGDEGKGKIVDLLAQHADLVCRYQGGPNAGHTIIVDGETFKLRAMPSGILLAGKECVIGGGCVVDPEVLLEELDGLAARGVATDGLVHLSGNAHLIMPWHVGDRPGERAAARPAADRHDAGAGSGLRTRTRRRGIGIRVQDLLDPKILRQKIEVALAEKNVLARARLRRRAARPRRASPRGYEGSRSACVRTSPTRRCSSTARSTTASVVLFEGAQGTLLDLDHGTYPFVTSSNPVAAYAAVAFGIGPNRIDAVVGVVEGVRDARRRRAVPDGDRRRRTRSASASSATSSGRSPDASGAAAGSTSSRCATRFG